jgi:very-short-patch-repair endonuclease
MKENARILRKTMTDAEHRIWYFLRDRRLKGYKFARQYIIGPYITDFICRDKKIILEVDGGQHSEAIAYDTKRTQFLEKQGYKVIRVWNNEVFKNIEGVLETLLVALGDED